MHRIALLFATFALAACSSRSPWAGGSAKSPVETPESIPAPSVVAATQDGVAAVPATPVAGAPKYSWQAKKHAEGEATVAQPPTGAPSDEAKARILALRRDLGLIAFVRKEKPDEGIFLQLEKDGKALLIRVVRSDDTMTTADIVAGQDPAKHPTLEVGEEVACGTPPEVPTE